MAAPNGDNPPDTKPAFTDNKCPQDNKGDKKAKAADKKVKKSDKNAKNGSQPPEPPKDKNGNPMQPPADNGKQAPQNNKK